MAAVEGAAAHVLRESRDAMMYALSRLPPVKPEKRTRVNKDGKPHSSRVRMMRCIVAINDLLGDAPR